jgi:hypothetical protein
MFKKQSLITLGGTTLLIFMGVVLSYATIPAPSGVIYACYSKSGGTLRVFDNAVTKCGQNETQLTWNQTGPQGPIGPVGPQGVQGAIGPQGPIGPSDVYFAGKVDSAGAGSSDVVQRTLLLPQGSWLISGKASVLRTDIPVSSHRELQCRIATSTSSGPTLLEDTLDFARPDIWQTGSVSLQGQLEVTAASGQTVFLICGQPATFQFENTSLSAIKTGTVTLQ